MSPGRRCRPRSSRSPSDPGRGPEGPQADECGCRVTPDGIVGRGSCTGFRPPTSCPARPTPSRWPADRQAKFVRRCCQGGIVRLNFRGRSRADAEQAAAPTIAPPASAAPGLVPTPSTERTAKPAVSRSPSTWKCEDVGKSRRSCRCGPGLQNRCTTAVLTRREAGSNTPGLAWKIGAATRGRSKVHRVGGVVDGSPAGSSRAAPTAGWPPVSARLVPGFVPAFAP